MSATTRRARGGEPGGPREPRRTTPPATPAARLGASARALVRLLARHKLAVRLAALALIAVFLVLFVRKTWAELPRDFAWRVDAPLLVAGYLLLVTQELSFAFIWRATLARLGSRLDVRSAQQIYLGSEFVRYVPGNVWHVFTRVLWAERRGVPRVTGLASMTVELATKIASAALVFAASLLFWPDARVLAANLPRGVPLLVGLISLPLLVIGLHPRLLSSALSAVLRLAGRPPVALGLRYRDVLAIALLWGASWVVAGVGFYLVVRALAPGLTSPAAVAIAAGIFALGWDIGFLSFITPSGLGFREAAIALLLGTSGVVGVPALALAIAVVARLLGTAAELVCVAGAHFLPGGRAPALEPSAEAVSGLDVAGPA